MIRNEFVIAPQPLTKTGSGSQDAISFSQTYQKTVGQKTKFSELYTWAVMTPYLQGVLMYLLAMAYPFVCVMIIIPGWHKILWTWLSFWIWVKLWDLGFAIVTVMERSVWAIVGNNADTTIQFSRALGMKKWGNVLVSCYGSTSNPLDSGLCSAKNPIPIVSIDLPSGRSFNDLDTWVDLVHQLDQAMTIGQSMDLDLQNSNYIYIMAALFLAVPAVTGQLVLGSKASAAGIAQNAFGGMAGEAGKAAGSGFSGNLSKQTEANAATAKQTFQAKAMRSGEAKGAVSNALNYGNRALAGELAANTWGAAAQGTSRWARMNSLSMEDRIDGIGITSDLMGAEIAMKQAEVGAFGGALNGGAGAFAKPGQSSPATTGSPSVGNQSSGNRNNVPTGAPQTPNAGNTPPNAPPQNVNSNAGAVAGRLSTYGSRLGQLALAAGEVGMQTYSQLLKGSEIQNSAIRSYGGYLEKRENRAMQAHSEAMQEQFSLNSYKESSLAKGYSDSARTQQELAEQIAQESTWESMRDFSNQTSGQLAAMGVSSAISPGQKPAIMKGMAASGMLGSANQKSALYTSNGDYKDTVDGYYGWLDSNFGEKQLNKTFKQTSAQENYGKAGRAFEGLTSGDPKNPSYAENIRSHGNFIADKFNSVVDPDGKNPDNRFGYKDELYGGKARTAGIAASESVTNLPKRDDLQKQFNENLAKTLK